MTPGKNIEERLEELGRAIGPDDLIADTVMSRIEDKAAPSPAPAGRAACPSPGRTCTGRTTIERKSLL